MVVAFRSRRAALITLVTLVAASAAPSLARSDSSASPDVVLDELAAILVAPGRPEPKDLFATSGLHVHFRLPGGREIGDDDQSYGPQQVAVLLREYFEAVVLRPFDPGLGARGRSSPDRRIWIERPDPGERTRISPHGILHLSVRADDGVSFEHQRLYVGLRETPAGWKVGEILHLP